jgi:hypothetical protein
MTFAALLFSGLPVVAEQRRHSLENGLGGEETFAIG